MKKIHYGWVLTAAGLAITAVTAGMAINCFSLFVVPVCTDLGYTRAQMGICQTINALGFLLASFFSGWVYKRVSVKRVMQISAVTITVFYFLFSRADALWMFYGCAAVCSLCASLLTWVPLSIILNNWFHKKRALAIGVAFMGSGIGGMIASSVGGRLIQLIGWRMTFVCFAGVLAFVLIPLVFFVIHEHPADKGMEPFGYQGKREEAALSGEGVVFKDALKSWKFYAMCMLFMVYGLGSNGFTATFVPHLEDSGFSPVSAATWYSAYMLLLAVGKLLLGGIIDFLGTRKSAVLSLALMIITLAGLVLCNVPMMMVVMILSSSVGNCFPTVGVPLVTRAVYGQRDYATFLGMLNAAVNVGSTISPSVLGIVRDASGSYAPAYIGIIAMAAVSFILVYSCIPGIRAEREGKMQ